jgi:acetyl-CoA carboxylase carboxyl transferase subunit beta
MLGDFNIAEPGALIGFAGPRVIRETIGKDLPKDFQSAEFVLEHGFLDFIVDRKELKTRLTSLLSMLK